MRHLDFRDRVQPFDADGVRIQTSVGCVVELDDERAAVIVCTPPRYCQVRTRVRKPAGRQLLVDVVRRQQCRAVEER